MKASVAIATYNGARYLHEQLQSIQSQTVSPHEVIISDDCSTDQTAGIIDEFSRTSGLNVTILRRSKNIGFIRNFESAIRHCSGDLVFLCDQDDVWLPNKIERVLLSFQSNRNIICHINDARLVNHDLSKFGKTKVEQVLQQGGMREEMVLGCCMAIRRTMMDLVLPIPEVARAHDHWFASVFGSIDGIQHSAEVLQLYRQHEANLSNMPSSRVEGLRFARARRLLNRVSRARSSDTLYAEMRLKIQILERLISYSSANSGELQDELRGNIEIGTEKLTREIEKLICRASLRSRSRAPRLISILKLSIKNGDSPSLASRLKDLVSDTYYDDELIRSARTCLASVKKKS